MKVEDRSRRRVGSPSVKMIVEVTGIGVVLVSLDSKDSVMGDSRGESEWRGSVDELDRGQR